MKVYIYFCLRCTDYFKPKPLAPKKCPKCFGEDMLMGPYLVDEIEYVRKYKGRKLL